MRTVASITLACLFVFLAGFNVWNMLASHRVSARGSRSWTQIHRVAGYAFIALFVILCFFMLMRVKGWPDELSPRLILHIGLALLLGPLLFTKVLAARFQKAARGLLAALGIGIFSVAFTLVALNISIHYLRAASTHRVRGGTSTAVIVIAVMGAAIGVLARGTHNAKPETQSSTRTHRNAESSVDRDAAGISNRGGTLELTLARMDAQTHDAKTLRFLLPRGSHFAPRAGQFLTFEWTIDGRVVRRSYSICSSPVQAGYIEITPKRVENGRVSRFLNDRAGLGLRVKAHGPYGNFCFDEHEHKRLVLIAGGSGITPMMAILRYIDDRCIQVPVTLIYSVRTEQDVIFQKELRLLRNRLDHFSLVMVLSGAGAEFPGWKGRLRREILEKEVAQPLESTFFVCGPPAFMQLAQNLLKEMQVQPQRILQESFGGGPSIETQLLRSGVRADVKCVRSAVNFSVSPGETLLESAEANGVVIPSGCRQGVCGTCATKLLEGSVEMTREDALTEQMRAEGFVLPCVSHAITDLTLDA